MNKSVETFISYPYALLDEFMDDYNAPYSILGKFNDEFPDNSVIDKPWLCASEEENSVLIITCCKILDKHVKNLGSKSTLIPSNLITTEEDMNKHFNEILLHLAKENQEIFMSWSNLHSEICDPDMNTLIYSFVQENFITIANGISNEEIMNYLLIKKKEE